jgi:hypothetical protein
MQLVAGSAIYVVLVVTSFYVLKFSEFRALLNRLKIAAARGGA